jgi:hypothetical protein
MSMFVLVGPYGAVWVVGPVMEQLRDTIDNRIQTLSVFLQGLLPRVCYFSRG